MWKIWHLKSWKFPYFFLDEKSYVDLMCGIKSVGELPWPERFFQGDLFVSPPGQSGNVDIGF